MSITLTRDMPVKKLRRQHIVVSALKIPAEIWGWMQLMAEEKSIERVPFFLNRSQKFIFHNLLQRLHNEGTKRQRPEVVERLWRFDYWHRHNKKVFLKTLQLLTSLLRCSGNMSVRLSGLTGWVQWDNQLTTYNSPGHTHTFILHTHQWQREHDEMM